MKAHTVYKTFQTAGRRELVRITEDVQAAVDEAGIQEGMALVSAMHITAGVWINDDEPGLHRDVLEWLAVAGVKLAWLRAVFRLKETRQRNKLPPFSFAQLANREIRRDAIDIGRERVALLITIRGAENSDERLLRQIDCPIVIIRHAIDVAGDLIPITPYQLRKRVFIAGPCCLEQRVIRSPPSSNLLLQGGAET